MKRLRRTIEKLKEDFTGFQYNLYHDQDKTIFQIVKEHGYFIQKFKYTTNDGYINTVFRIMAKEEGIINTLESRKFNKLFDNAGEGFKINDKFMRKKTETKLNEGEEVKEAEVQIHFDKIRTT